MARLLTRKVGGRPYTGFTVPPLNSKRPQWHLGQDEDGIETFVSCAGNTGGAFAGMPGYGKTSAMTYIMCQAARSAWVQPITLDGLGGNNFARWDRRCWLHCGADVFQALAIMESMEELRLLRLQKIRKVTGKLNTWDAGISEIWPLIFLIIDECKTFFSYDKSADSEYKEAVDRIVYLVENFFRMGRQAGFWTLVASQRLTVDALPGQIQSAMEFGACGASRSRYAMTTALGDEITDPENEGYTPRQFVGAGNEGKFVTTLVKGSGKGAQPFTILRTPQVTDAFADGMAWKYAHLRRNPLADLKAA